jgi:hypothetical protein
LRENEGFEILRYILVHEDVATFLDEEFIYILCLRLNAYVVHNLHLGFSMVHLKVHFGTLPMVAKYYFTLFS